MHITGYDVKLNTQIDRRTQSNKNHKQSPITRYDEKLNTQIDTRTQSKTNLKLPLPDMI